MSFYKINFFPIYFNIGKNHTKGSYYEVNDQNDYKGKVFVVYDVPAYFNVNNASKPNGLSLLESTQYPGFLIELDKFKNVEDYLQSTFGRNSRMKMRKYSNRLDTCFDISTKMFFGTIDEKEYDLIFEYFMMLLNRRFSDKQISNNNMHPSEWNFYKEVAYPLIIEKKASLFVVFDNKTPIAITYNYHIDDIVIDAITVFDINYVKFNLGYLNNLKLIEWCFENNIKKLDFSKGYFDYKKRLCSKEYDFNYHILYDSNSIKAKIIAYFAYTFYEFKSYLRKKEINTKLHKITFLLNNKKTEKVDYEIVTLDVLPDTNSLTELYLDSKTNSPLNKIVNDFLYGISKHRSEIKIYSVDNQNNLFIISSEFLTQKVLLK
ncbi:GNAT family N-acetyltransferase [Flavobacteriaceae bacterium XHP0103]|uniref:GNAT family N-acetyltransferase n=1 Tax=Marixanthotalea marina TaxID=2844359 RepID=UPI002989E7F1|nr:GNAT family N-acetyltransferase [Marixanthotalea marina]MBU3822304.1 GNAT family N-acetyltransferase [Marixanthotalea marina]